MQEFFDLLMVFFSSKSIWMYLFIFLGKILEVAVSTLRIMLINRGERAVGVIAAVIEYTLWIFITGSVLSDFQSDPLKVLVLILAFGFGNFFGSWLEEKLAFGLCTISIIASNEEEAKTIARKLRSNGHAVTLVNAEGMGGQPREMLTLTVRRKYTHDILSLINAENTHAMVTVANTSSLKGGFLKKPHRFPIGMPQFAAHKKTDPLKPDILIHTRPMHNAGHKENEEP